MRSISAISRPSPTITRASEAPAACHEISTSTATAPRLDYTYNWQGPRFAPQIGRTGYTRLLRKRKRRHISALGLENKAQMARHGNRAGRVDCEFFKHQPTRGLTGWSTDSARGPVARANSRLFAMDGRRLRTY